MLPFRLVHFFGPDGSGKSTQVKLLVDYYQKHGVNVRKFWLRSPHTFAYVLWKLLVRIGFYRSIQNECGAQIKLPAVQNSLFLKRVWYLAEFISVLPLIILSKLCLMQGYVLVAERYVLDTITTISYFLDDSTSAQNFLSRVLLRFIPRDTAFIFLDCNFEAIRERRAKFYRIPRSTSRRFFQNSEPPAPNLEPFAFIDFQRRMYAGFAHSYSAVVIDTSDNSVEATFNKIQNYLFNDN